MNPATYEQVEIPKALVGARAPFLLAGMSLPIEFVEGRAVNVIFPDIVEIKIADTAPPTHQQQDSAFKTAELENGVDVMVPQFVKTGDVIRLDLQTMKYMDRVKAEAKAGRA
jgi:elongation factor P